MHLEQLAHRAVHIEMNPRAVIRPAEFAGTSREVPAVIQQLRAVLAEIARGNMKRGIR